MISFQVLLDSTGRERVVIYNIFFFFSRMVLERIQIFAYRLECEIFRVFGYFVIFLAKNIVEISFRIVESKYCEAHRVSDRD